MAFEVARDTSLRRTDGLLGGIVCVLRIENLKLLDPWKCRPLDRK